MGRWNENENRDDIEWLHMGAYDEKILVGMYGGEVRRPSTVEVDGNVVQTCGSTVIFSDTSLKKYDIELPADVDLSDNNQAAISTPSDLRFKDYWTVQYWWYNHQGENQGANRRIVIIQSQTGEPICMYTGNDVTWEVSKNLPKTTLIHIDGKALYIHRANFAIIDTSVFGG